MTDMMDVMKENKIIMPPLNGMRLYNFMVIRIFWNIFQLMTSLPATLILNFTTVLFRQQTGFIR